MKPKKTSKIFLGSDHAGFKLKEDIKHLLGKIGYKYEDLGVYTDKTKSDYPETAIKVAKKVLKYKCSGILMCGTGIGEAIVANKLKGIRAANCFNELTAKMSRAHNNSNILCLGARIINKNLARKITKTWLETDFSKEPRHIRRVKQIEDLENVLCR